MTEIFVKTTELKRHLPLIPGRETSWNLCVFPAWQETFRSIADVSLILSQPVKIIQQTKYGLVLLLKHSGRKFIAKRSLLQERRRWTQFTSLYRYGEGNRTIRNMQKLYESGLVVPEPVLVLEKTYWGFTVASWIVYNYLEGETCTFEHTSQIAQTLRAMHEKGWVHRDPHVWNFLHHHGEIRILDCAKARPWRSKYARMYDVVLLDKCSPGAAKHYGVEETDRVYRLAKFQNQQIQRWRRIKRIIRFWRG